MARPKIIYQRYTIASSRIRFQPPRLPSGAAATSGERLAVQRRCGSEGYAEAIAKFVVGPVDSGSKFHFLWSLGEGEEARGFGKTVLLGTHRPRDQRRPGPARPARKRVREGRGRRKRRSCGDGHVQQDDVTGLAAVSLEQVRYLAQMDPTTGNRHLWWCGSSSFGHLGRVRRPRADGRSDAEAEASETSTRETNLLLGGKTLGSPDRRLLDHFANADWRGLASFVCETQAPRTASSCSAAALIIARAAGVKRVLLFIDQVEDFASADTPKKRRSLEVERFRDIADRDAAVR